MAFFKNPEVLEKCEQTYFDKKLLPQNGVRRAGIYQCRCGFEVMCRVGERLPCEQICSMHVSPPGPWPDAGKVEWQLVVLLNDRKLKD